MFHVLDACTQVLWKTRTIGAIAAKPRSEEKLSHVFRHHRFSRPWCCSVTSWLVSLSIYRLGMRPSKALHATLTPKLNEWKPCDPPISIGSDEVVTANEYGPETVDLALREPSARTTEGPWGGATVLFSGEISCMVEFGTPEDAIENCRFSYR